MKKLLKPILEYLSLFGAVSTLLCCALPALLVSLGLGAVFAGFISAVPQVIWLSEHKVLVFSVAGVLLALSALVQFLGRNAPCPLDPETGQACSTRRKLSSIILYFSIALYAIGFFFAFIAPKLFAA